jgi:DeoR/GlpR family transcriptional regulator of sugar metabolism
MSSVSQVIQIPSAASGIEQQQHFSVSEIAARWSVSEDTIRRLFEHEPGVLVIEQPRGRFSRRRYRTLRIRAAVMERVHRRQSVVNSETRG